MPENNGNNEYNRYTGSGYLNKMLYDKPVSYGMDFSGGSNQSSEQQNLLDQVSAFKKPYDGQTLENFVNPYDDVPPKDYVTKPVTKPVDDIPLNYTPIGDSSDPDAEPDKKPKAGKPIKFNDKDTAEKDDSFFGSMTDSERDNFVYMASEAFSNLAKTGSRDKMNEANLIAANLNMKGRAEIDEKKNVSDYIRSWQLASAAEKKATAKEKREQGMYDRYTKMSDAYMERMNEKDS